ncbi:MAG: hypothetical protein CMJ25_18330 [Phycisphaerae bacterium]|nr:hypothetical protein [Phycisphaerae bacterium]|tara:strand:+ start:8850 stop:9491 length:642 start_codon:yes stop_codon:yes gene_type:complete
MSSFDELLENFTGNDGGFDWMKGLVSVGGAYALDKSGLMQANIPQSGYQGGIPEYQVNRQIVPNTYDPNRRAGSGGQRYFTDAQYVPKANATPAAPMSAEGLAALNASNPAQEKIEPQMLATGGIAELKKGKYLDGASDGMADKVPATIDGQQEARLSDGEFVIPADVVSHLGNGNSDAGAKVLKDMMDRVRKARTGNEKQGKEIDPKKFIPA